MASMLPSIDLNSMSSDGETSDDGEEVIDDLGPPLLLMRNVSGYDVRNERLEVSCDALVRGSEHVFFKLLTASVNGDLAQVRKSLNKLTKREASQLNPLRDSPSYGLNALHVAKTVDIAAELVDFGIPVDIQGLNGQTPLHVHTHNNNPGVIKYLIDRGATVDAKTAYNGATPLQWAVASDNLEVVKLLVRAGADVSYPNENLNTALHMVGSTEVARFLVANNARTDVCNADGRLPLEEASSRAMDDAQLDVALYLLELSRKAYFSNDRKPEFVPSTVAEDDEGSTEESQTDELESYQNSKVVSPDNITRDAVKVHAMHVEAKQRWDLLKRAFISGKASAIRHSPSPVAPVSKSQEFYATFFEVIVKERPNLAIKILDKQRTFLYWENNARVFSYNTSLLGTIPYCSSAMKQMVLDERLDLISHIVVQYSLNLRWILFTREVLFFEFVVHVVFVLLLLGTTCSAERNIDLLVFAWGKKYSVFENPSEANLVKVGMVFLNLLLMFINIRYMYIQVVQSKISSILSGKVYSWWDAMHCRLRNEQFYLLPHLFILISQVLRCFPESEHLYVVADILVALVTWRLFYRGLSFGEGFESIGVPMCTIKQMIDVNRIYFLVLFVFITGFSHSMYLIFRDEPSSLEYGSFQMSWITLFFFVFNLDVGSLNEEAVSYRKYFGFLVIGVYMSIVCLVVFNLIIAVMTSTYESIQGNSKQQWLLQKARLIVFYESYENAINSILYKRSIESVRKGHLPPGDPKHYVKEQANGVVLVEVPRSYIRECLQFRLSTFQLFHRFRYSVFKRWKHLRRSPSFLWPETSGRSSSSAHRLLSHDSTSSSNPLEVLQLKSELLVVGKFQMLRRKKSSEKKVVSVSAGKRDKSMTGRKLSQAERDNEKMVSMLVKMQLSQERMHRELASLRTQVLELSLSGKANGG